MAVYERAYRRYAGLLVPEGRRFLALPRYAFGEVFRSRLFLAFYVLCFVPMLIAGAILYARHNETFLGFLRLANLTADDLLAIGPDFFRVLTGVSGFLAFLVSVFVGPGLIARDLANNALPLYLGRPLSRSRYLLGKALVLVALLSAITWVPLELLFVFQGYLEGGAWLGEHGWLGASVFAASAVWIAVLVLLSLALSAWVRWRAVASLAMFGVFFVSSALGQLVNFLFRHRLEREWGHLINLGELIRVVGLGLFRRADLASIPVWSAWLALAAGSALCLGLLARKVRPYEEVR